MKKILYIFIVLLLSLSNVDVINALNVQSISNTTVEYLDDGSYYTTTIEINISTCSTNTVSGTKTTVLSNSDNVAQWYVKVTGNFTYTGSSATCTSSSVSASVYNSKWKISSKQSSKYQNTANARATASYYYDGEITSSKTKTVTLTCSKTGVLS